MTNANIFNGDFPVIERELFIGREESIEYLFNNIINGDVRQNAAIVAERGTGKSSLLNALFFKRYQEKYNYDSSKLLIYINFDSKIDSIEEFFENMYDRLCFAVETSSFASQEVKDSMQEYHGGGRIKVILYNALRKLANYGLKFIFIIDNLDKGANKTNFSVKEFSFLRSLVVENLEFEVRYIVTSERKLKDISSEVENSSFDTIFGLAYFNDLLSPEGSEEYITTNFKEVGFNVPEDDCTVLHNISGGNITILKKACREYLEILQRENFDEDYEVDEDELLENTVKSCERYFEKLLSSSSAIERKVFLKLLAGEEISNNYKDMDGIRDAESRAILLRDENEYVFTSKAFKDYLMKIGKNNIASEEEITYTSDEALRAVIREEITRVVDYDESIRSFLLEKSKGKEELTEKDIDDYLSDVGQKISNTDNSIPKSINNSVMLELWETFTEEEKKEIILAESVNQIFKDVYDSDLSAVTIIYCKFIEKLVYRTIGKFTTRINPKYKLSRKEEDRILSISETDVLMVGEALYIVNRGLKDEFIRACETAEINHGSFVKTLRRLQDVRNRSAHTGKIVTRKNVDMIRRILFFSNDNFIKTIYKFDSI